MLVAGQPACAADRDAQAETRHATDWTATVLIIVQLIFLEGILSIDNAAVLGAMVRPLPSDQPIPWPIWLQPIAVPMDRFLGHQRQAALKVGLLGAYAGRALMLVLAAFVVQNPWLRVIGALYLLRLALSELGAMRHGHHHEEEAAVGGVKQVRGFWGVVVAVELADLAFSLDNVVAAVGLSEDLRIVLLGVGIGIVTMRFAAQIFTRMISWEPALEVAAYLLVLAISVELLLDTLLHVHLGEIAQFSISAGILLLTILFARWAPARPLRRLFRPLLVLAERVSRAFDLLLWPLAFVWRRSARLLSPPRS
jgi:tellurite resistance protein TerC